MPSRISRPRPIARFVSTAVVLFSVCTTLAITGCGVGNPASASSEPVVIPGFSGKIFGGPTPVIGATVKIYSTGAVTVATGTVTGQAYRTGTLLQEASTAAGMSAGQDTNQYGAFTFAGGYLCPAGQFAYIVASGGNTGAGAVNPASVLVAALGRCEDLYTGPLYTGGTIYINEITTIAAAYALGNFAGTSGTGAATAVGIGADANNNATTGTTTQAAGLRHAFQNAANLVNVFTNASTGTTNGAYATLPGNAAALVPQAEINALGNSLVACVNSTGSIAGPCGALFGATTLAGGATPTNTFQAMINLAANPLLTGAGTNPASANMAYVPADIYNLASPTVTVYNPTLTASPVDWSITIHYPAGIGAGTAQGLQYPASGTLDMNDNLYVGNQSVFSSGVATTGKSNILGFSSNGTFLGISPDSTVSTSGLGISADALGNVYQLGSTNTSTAVALIKFPVNGGTPAVTSTSYNYANAANQGIPTSSAVDQANNVWYCTNSSQAANKSVWELKTAAPNPSFQFQGTSALASQGIAIDPNQNIWVSSLSSTAANISILQNVSTSGPATYAPVTTTTPQSANVNVALATAALTNSGGNLYGLAFAPATGSTPNYIAYAASNSPISAGVQNQGLAPLVPAVTNAAVTGFTQGTQVIGTTGAPISNPRYIASDASGAVWIADTGGNRIRFYSPNVNAALQNNYIRPCFVAAAATTCTIALSGPRYVLPDSTGSLWVVSIGTASNTGSVDQVIGAATPTYPLLSLGLSNTKP